MSLLITNGKSHTVFRLVPTLVTLSDLNGVIAFILLYFTEFDSCRPITSQWMKTDLYCLHKTNPPCSAGSAISELLVMFRMV